MPTPIVTSQQYCYISFSPTQQQPKSMKTVPYCNTNVAVLSNTLCKSYYNLSLVEHRLIKLYLQSITDYFETPLNVSTPFTLTVQEYAKTWNIEVFNARREVREAVIGLFKREIYKLGEDGESFIYSHWISDATYVRDSDTVELYWSRTILSHISLLKERFTKLDLTEIRDFNSTYSFRLYEILTCAIGENSFKNPKFDVEVLMDMMQVPESYRNYRTFKARVLTPCTSELQNKTNKFSKLSLIEHKRKGSKKIVEVEFSGVGIGKKYKNL